MTESPSVRVLLVDDEELVRAGLRALVDGEQGIAVVGEAGDGAEAISRTKALSPDVVCMDVRMPNVDGIQATRVLTERHPDTKVLVLTTFENDDYVHEALQAGAQGFLLKRSAPDAVVSAILTVHQGDSLLYPDAVRRLVAAAAPAGPARPGLPMLSQREGDVLRLIARGCSNAEIAAELYVTIETVKTHVTSILGKLGVRDRVQAVIRAYETGFVPLD
ncbi:response regulator transcription factor [Luteipulveratus sp. YIM 133132]|uniref:response regulator transcription factor n=1 Tax=Luteipulveratus flavus TaxID=3031728 RepID=UPI0023B0DEB5|nr:response regulator transcription factor [Luteipulveratus sp. YIM 133132]MDE9366877.1 response regulator transcription factor [Luteipulveratus sp. YIM 133132]